MLSRKCVISSEWKGLQNCILGVQMEDEDSYSSDGPSPATARSKVKIAMSRGASDRCWPISLERKVP